MVLMHECLIRMGVALHDNNYSSMILVSLPKLYTTHLETFSDSTGSSGNPLTAHISSPKQSTYTKSVSCVLDRMPSQETRTPHSKPWTIKARVKRDRNLE